MNVTVDQSRCTGIGVCESIAPDVFEVGDDGALLVLQETVADEDTLVAEAVRSCPARALSLQPESE
jgi:ferredoxin